jgi:hypothetical protein
VGAVGLILFAGVWAVFGRRLGGVWAALFFFVGWRKLNGVWGPDQKFFPSFPSIFPLFPPFFSFFLVGCFIDV